MIHNNFLRYWFTLMPKKKYTYLKRPGFVGCPTLFKEEYCNQIIEIARTCEPYNYTNICCVELKISRDTLWEWRNKHPRFADAYKTGLQVWERRLNILALESKMDFKYYRSFLFRVLGENCEPNALFEQNNTINVTGLQQLQYLNKDLPNVTTSVITQDLQQDEIIIQ